MGSRQLVTLAATVRVTTADDVHPLAGANVALDRLRRGEVDGAAVLTT